MSDLIVIEKQTASDLFKSKDGLMALLNNVSIEVLKTVPDISTTKGRDEVKSLAYKVSQSKTYVDGIGKEIVDELKELPKIIDANRKLAREFLDDLRDKVREPLTKWEAEQEAIKQAEIARIAAEQLAKQVEEDHEIALIMNKNFDLERESRLAKQAKEEADRMEAIKAEATAKAEADAQAKIRAAELAAELAEKRAQESIAAEKKAHADALAKQQKDEEDRLANEAHVRSINTKALKDLIEHANLTNDQAKLVVVRIAQGRISSVKINY